MGEALFHVLGNGPAGVAAAERDRYEGFAAAAGKHATRWQHRNSIDLVSTEITSVDTPYARRSRGVSIYLFLESAKSVFLPTDGHSAWARLC
jgi:hypothetical protein